MIVSEWLNSPGPYVQYTYNPDMRLVSIIRRHGFCFDNVFWYWIPKTRQGKDQQTLIVKRAPLWTYPTKSVPAEKSQRKKALQSGLQRKLAVLEVII